MPRTSRSQVVARGLGAVLVLALVWAPGRPAAADAVGDETARARQLAAQIDQLGRQDSKLAERYDGAVLEQTRATAAIAPAQRALDQAGQRAQDSNVALRNLAVDAYERGGAAPVTTVRPGSAQAIEIQMSYVKLVSGRSSDALDQARAARVDLKRRQADLVAAKAASDASVRAIAKARDDLNRTESQLRGTLAQVKGHLADLVAAQQAANEAAAATAAQARTAAAAASAAAHPARPGAAPAPAAGPIVASGPGAQAALTFARAQLGKPYVYGAAGPDAYDCSGLTMRSWGAGGVSLPHHAASQYSAVHHIPFSALQPGDLVFESGLGHVGIYIGGGQMIHVPHSGDVVRISALWSSMNLAGRP